MSLKIRQVGLPACQTLVSYWQRRDSAACRIRNSDSQRIRRLEAQLLH
jgi:hypothetical protein